MSPKPDAEELRIRRLLRRMVDRGETDPNTEQPQPDAVTSAAAAAHADYLWDRRPQPLPHPDGDWWDALYADETAAAAAQPDQEDEAQPGRRERWMRIPPWWSGRHVDTTPPDDEDDDEPEDGKEEPDDEDGVDDQEDEQEDDDEEVQPRSRSVQPRKRSPRSRSRGKRSRRQGPGVPQSPLDRPPAPRQSLLDAYAAVPPRIRWLVYHGSAAAAGYRIGWVDYATRTADWIAANGFLTASAIFWYVVSFLCLMLYRRMSPRWLVVGWLCTVPIASVVTGTLLYGTGWTHLDLELPL